MEAYSSINVKAGLMTAFHFKVEKWSPLEPGIFRVRTIAKQPKLKQLPEIESHLLNLIDESNSVFQYRIPWFIPLFHNHIY